MVIVPPRGCEGVRGSGWGCGISRHAYSRKYSRFVRLRVLSSESPYFRYLPSQNNTQLFCSVAYRLSLAQARKSAWMVSMVELIEDEQRSQNKNGALLDSVLFWLPLLGLNQRQCFATLNGEFAMQTSLSATSCAIMMS